MSPHELLGKLAALVPPPRLHLTRDHGVLAPHAEDQAETVPAPAPGVASAEARPAARSPMP
ncbi:MAG: transposase [Candidatus Latescibacterota bacterium]